SRSWFGPPPLFRPAPGRPRPAPHEAGAAPQIVVPPRTNPVLSSAADSDDGDSIEPGSLLVLEKENLVGIITQTDIFDAMLRAFGIRKVGTRIVIETEDRVGALAELLQIVKEHRINVIGVASLEKSDRMVQIMLRLSTADASELVDNIKQKGFHVIAVS
ncbi:MAG: ACT domain-containing protein, partial [Peptococcaceae bacterium]|nr:ACT domain-containing protein [Peptococcaceae bacterium]